MTLALTTVICGAMQGNAMNFPSVSKKVHEYEQMVRTTFPYLASLAKLNEAIKESVLDDKSELQSTMEQQTASGFQKGDTVRSLINAPGDIDGHNIRAEIQGTVLGRTTKRAAMTARAILANPLVAGTTFENGRAHLDSETKHLLEQIDDKTQYIIVDFKNIGPWCMLPTQISLVRASDFQVGDTVSSLITASGDQDGRIRAGIKGTVAGQTTKRAEAKLAGTPKHLLEQIDNKTQYIMVNFEGVGPWAMLPTYIEHAEQKVKLVD